MSLDFSAMASSPASAPALKASDKRAGREQIERLQARKEFFSDLFEMFAGFLVVCGVLLLGVHCHQ
jgi:hypothetical protein